MRYSVLWPVLLTGLLAGCLSEQKETNAVSNTTNANTTQMVALGDKLFHDAWGLGLIRCRKRAACKSDAVPMRLFNITSVFYEHQRQSPHRF